MFEVPESDIIRVRVDENVILGKKPIEFIRSTDTKSAESTESDVDSEQNKAKTYA